MKDVIQYSTLLYDMKNPLWNLDPQGIPQFPSNVYDLYLLNDEVHDRDFVRQQLMAVLNIEDTVANAKIRLIELKGKYLIISGKEERVVKIRDELQKSGFSLEMKLKKRGAPFGNIHGSS